MHQAFSDDIPSPTNGGSTREHVDVLILCPHADELEPYRDLSDLDIKVNPDVLFGLEVFRFEITASSDLATAPPTRRYKAVAAICGYAALDAAARSAQLISKLNPACVVLSGICAGDSSRGINKGDVIFARSVWDRGAGKREIALESDQQVEAVQHDVRVFETRRQWTESAAMFRQLFTQEHAELLDTRFPAQERLESAYGDNRHAYSTAVHVGDVATVAEVTVDASTFATLQETKRHTIALEMEGTVVANIAVQAGKPWMVIKGVQDHALREQTADGGEVDVYAEFRTFAAYAARTFVIAFCARQLKDVLVSKPTSRPVSSVDGPPPAWHPDWTPVRRKLALDFQRSALKSPGDVQEAVETARVNLETAELLKQGKSDRRLIKPDYRVLSKAWVGRPSRRSIEAVEKLDDLRISCAAIYPAAVATFCSIREKYLPGLRLEVETVNSIELVDSLGRHEEFDFVVAAEDPFFLIGGSGTYRYRRVLPILRAPQWLFQRTGQPAGGPRLLYIAQGSSGATQFMGDILQGVQSKAIDAFDIRRRALELDFGEQIPAWEPIASQLEQEPALEKVPDSRYDIHVSFYCYAANWVASEARRVALGHFCEVFISEWKTCSQDIEYCVSLLEREDDFLSTFMLGAGVHGP